MASVSFRHVFKTYRSEKKPSVDDFNLEIADGEFLVLVGPSGCGKTTTLRMLSGLEDISDGEIYIGDRYINYVSPKDRDIAMVFQNYALYPNLTVYENMALGLKLRKTAKHEIDMRVKKAARILEITNYLDKKPGQLSGGQKQRVALGRAIVREPKVFLMDEPLSNLDAKLRAQTRAELIRLHRELGTTTVYVTHDQTEAMTMGTRIVVMKDGVIQQADTPQRIYRHPANLFVAGFIGSPAMNFIEGGIAESEGRMYFNNKRLRLRIPESFYPSLREAPSLRSVVLGIRPEHIVSDPAWLQHFDNKVSALIDIKELMGADTYLYLNVGETNLVARVDDAEDGFELKSAVEVGFQMEKAHFFDAATGANLSADSLRGQP
ncbi:ABC transporter ATP-binding protein [Paenibacillus sacheonensis]|uniref:sn-glycerol-3-phosphate ABC transporter ATP-binding protein UgpC n=1 Tax=Paenibacillus sacheonensis TaxID=742054 RepID=A0A7X4YJE8_9BACL|nr:sn-glycerol-3-phosphate ABC transporter ATP-binding protein UgpC [Paenibacillus sacheonensis]MBM7564242.1 multiple sugar transport system ATP-binding protein [Paenibacillus sacheonensis]NBC67435.1 sn-glycerol-3-phosphate ABC transporter ATP-binding protein UgpC [Paenibacillus sacheonensis]